MYKLGSCLSLKSPISSMSHLDSLLVVLVSRFSLTNVKFKKHIDSLVFFQ